MERTAIRLALALCASLVTAGSALATPFVLEAELSGDLVQPFPVQTGASGSAVVTYDDVARTMTVQATLLGILVGDLNGTIGDPGSPFHLHVGPPDSPGPHAILLSDVAAWDPVFDNSVEVGASIDLGPFSVEDALANNEGGFNQGIEAFEDLLLSTSQSLTYLAVHTNAHPGGELRGNLGPVPEPSSALLLGSGLAALAMRRRSRR